MENRVIKCPWFCRRHGLKMEDIPFNLLTQKELL